MYKIQNSTKFRGFGETSWEAGDTSDSSTRKAELDDLIKKANSVPITEVLRFYGVRLIQHKKAICPFITHSSGKESTPSFTIYSETNTFFCYGCSTGSKGVDFVSLMDNISRPKAAAKIINLYGSGVMVDIEQDQNAYSERMRLYMEFSNYVYDFMQSHLRSEHAIMFIEEITSMFDDMNIKYKLGNDALESLVFKLKDQIDRYSCQQL